MNLGHDGGALVAVAGAGFGYSSLSPGYSLTPNQSVTFQIWFRPQASGSDIQKLKTEISRLELLIKKLQTELQIERQYNQALELHVKSLTSID